jgi:hypothetical protein
MQSEEKNSFYGWLQKAAILVVWVLYQFMRLCLGLAVHPYKTTREIMRGVWFVPLVFLPSGLLLWIFATGRIAAWVLEVPVYFRDGLGVIYATLLFSLMFWQALLLYLSVRFGKGLRRR